MSLRENDSETEICKKLVHELAFLEPDAMAFARVLARLFTLADRRNAIDTPETWKRKLQQALVQLGLQQSQKTLTVICLEDLHWSDPSTLAVFRSLVNAVNLPVLFLGSFRSEKCDFSPDQIFNPYYGSTTIYLRDLHPEVAQAMLNALLETTQPPAALSTVVAEQLGGNPFFIEEMVNALVDNGTLERTPAGWRLNGPVGTDAVLPNIGAVIAARLDQSGAATKQIVQAASVIGKQFSTALLKKISDKPETVTDGLAILSALGLILKCDNTDAHCFGFKHALIQEVAYNSLLKRQRKDLHERIGLALEDGTAGCTDALAETLAHHFSSGHSQDKAVDYLRRSARKGLKKYAVAEAHQYYEKAFRILALKVPPADANHGRLLSLLIEWFFVFHLRGRYRDALSLLIPYETVARTSPDPHLKGLFLACLGCAYQKREQLAISRDYLQAAIAIGEPIDDHKVVAFAAAHLIWTCTDMGRLEEALQVAEKAECAAFRFREKDTFWSDEMDQDLLRSLYTGMAVTHMFRGDSRSAMHWEPACWPTPNKPEMPTAVPVPIWPTAWGPSWPVISKAPSTSAAWPSMGRRMRISIATPNSSWPGPTFPWLTSLKRSGISGM